MSYEIGDRIGAILAADGPTAEFFGYGTYQGSDIPPPGVGLFGMDYHRLKFATPKLLLDNGDVVFGCECWWGREAKIRAMLDGKQVTVVRIGDVRVARLRV
jgi:hypothetical protein